jgi:DNA integrity scanning protein DisA with diadenylate cyclase activity
MSQWKGADWELYRCPQSEFGLNCCHSSVESAAQRTPIADLPCTSTCVSLFFPATGEVARMKSGKSSKLSNLVSSAISLAVAEEADALMIFPESQLSWEKIKSAAGDLKVIAVIEDAQLSEGIKEVDIRFILLEMQNSPRSEKLTQGVLESVANETLPAGASVVAVYSAFEDMSLDTISWIHMHEHLGRLTIRDLKALETTVPLETLKLVIDLAVEIGREGREGKPVGTMFVVGDHRAVLEQSHPANLELIKGYKRKERHLSDPQLRECVKELALMDGAFVIAQDGTIEGNSRIIDTAPVKLTMSSGLGSRHWAGAAISKNTKAIAVVVSESNGTVRIFQDGEVILRIAPMRQAMKFKDFDVEPHAHAPEKPAT